MIIVKKILWYFDIKGFFNVDIYYFIFNCIIKKINNLYI